MHSASGLQAGFDQSRQSRGGKNVTQTIEGQARYSVNVRYPQVFRDSPDALMLMPIVTPQGQHIALGDVADVFIENGPSGIKSENARLNGWVYIDIDGVDIGSYVESARALLDEHLTLPSGYSISWAGQYEYMQRAKEKLTYVVPLTLAIIVVLLYLNFKSFAEVTIIMCTLPLAMIGGVWLMYLQGFNFSVAVGVGFIALAGVAVEIGVIMLVYLNQAYQNMCLTAKRADKPLSLAQLQQAIIEGAGLRVRPVHWRQHHHHSGWLCFLGQQLHRLHQLASIRRLDQPQRRPSMDWNRCQNVSRACFTDSGCEMGSLFDELIAGKSNAHQQIVFQ